MPPVQEVAVPAPEADDVVELLRELAAVMAVPRAC